MNQAQLKVGAVVRNKDDHTNYRKIIQIDEAKRTIHYLFTFESGFEFKPVNNLMCYSIDEFLLGNEFIRNENDFYADQNESVKVPKSARSKYNRDLIALGGEKVEVDVYRVLTAFKVTDPALQHAAKKILCAGLRGHKDRITDLEDILDSVKKAIVMENQQ